MALVFHPLVQTDLNAVLQHYETEGSVKLADRFFTEVEMVIRAIERNPARFPSLNSGLRRANLKVFPYHFLFRQIDGHVRILVLRHHKRRPTYGTSRR